MARKKKQVEEDEKDLIYITNDNMDQIIETMYSFSSNAELYAYSKNLRFADENCSHSTFHSKQSNVIRNLDLKALKVPNWQLASRYHRILITKMVLTANAEGRVYTKDEMSATFRLYEAKVAQVREGDITDDEIYYLQSFPNTRYWNEYADLTLDECNEYYGSDNQVVLHTSTLLADNAMQYFNYALEELPEAEREAVRKQRDDYYFDVLRKKYDKREDAIKELQQYVGWRKGKIEKVLNNA